MYTYPYFSLISNINNFIIRKEILCYLQRGGFCFLSINFYCWILADLEWIKYKDDVVTVEEYVRNIS